MIIPINNGRSITPIYIPTPTSTHSTQVSNQDDNEEIQPKEITGVDIFFIILISVFLLSILIYFIHLMKKLTK